MTRIMLLGDIHGASDFFETKVMPVAIAEKIKWIYQVGDFGYWEHTDQGIMFLNNVSNALVGTGIELVFIQGNHDKTSLIPNRYNPIDGFYSIRPSVWFAPNGTHWTVEGTGFVALGGAYSIDKQDRLDMEAAKAETIFKSRILSNREYSANYVAEKARSETVETLWFPEEEMTDVELDSILNGLNPDEVDVILAHDKPFMSNPGIRLLPIDECIPNQRRLQKAVNVLKPKLFVHGHLHIRYRDTIRCGDDNSYTVVEGLGADVPNFTQSANDWRADDAWEILNL
jgi:predicted phosphodiesterase